MLVIDGSQGEGGGQILRSSLGLSLITGTPFRIENVRAARKRPGLMRQHLTCVQAAREVCDGSVTGDHIGSSALSFAPGAVRGGAYSFSVGSAGSTSLVLQTVLPALARCDRPSTVELRGGTHNPLAPTFDFLTRALFPLIARMGPNIESVLQRPGFAPAGGGHASFRIRPCAELRPLSLLERGPILRRSIRALVAIISSDIGTREITTLAGELGWDRGLGEVVRADDSIGPGNVVSVEVESEAVTEVFTGFGDKGVRAEKVARSVAAEVERYLAAEVPVGAHLADQLLLWLALAGGGAFRTVEPTAHTRTHVDVIRSFLDVDVSVEPAGGAWEIRIGA